MNENRQKTTRRKFKSPDELPKILIVTEKLLTGYDAPILYAMYLDKPLKDHTLLQAIARVNRPYEGKTCGLIVDYIGIFDNLQRALSFDPDDIGRGLIDIKMLKERFQDLMGQAREILNKVNIQDEQNRLNNITEHFFDEEKRKEFMKLFKETERSYEILSPDEFLRDYINDYKLLVQVHQIVYNQFNPEAERKRIFRETLKKTEKLIREEVELRSITDSLPVYEITKDIANLVKADNISERVKVVNLHRSLIDHIERSIEKQPYLLSIYEEIEKTITQLRERQKSVEAALHDLTKLAEQVATSQEEQTKSGLSKEEFSTFWVLRSFQVSKPEAMAGKIYKEMDKHKEWIYNTKIERKLRTQLYKLLLNSAPENQLVELVKKLLKTHRVFMEATQ